MRAQQGRGRDVRFLQVSTDEVYGDIPAGRSVETDALAPRSPYAAAKASSELLVRATPSEGTGVPLNGALAFVDNNVDSTTGTVLLKARFSNPEGTIWPGQYMSVALQLYVDPNALTLPAPAVLTGQQGTYVYTALALFRQLPAGVPGAYRLFANLLGLKGNSL